MAANPGMVATVRKIQALGLTALQASVSLSKIVKETGRELHWRRSERAMVLAAWDAAIREVYATK